MCFEGITRTKEAYTTLPTFDAVECYRIGPRLHRISSTLQYYMFPDLIRIDKVV